MCMGGMPNDDPKSLAGGISPKATGVSNLPVRKVAMLDPGFREVQEASVLRPRILGIQKPKDSQDRRNLKFLGLAFLVALVIFGALEYKQLHEAAHEAKKSALDYFNHQ